MKNHDVALSTGRSPLRSWVFAIPATVVAVLLVLFTTLMLLTPPARA